MIGYSSITLASILATISTTSASLFSAPGARQEKLFQDDTLHQNPEVSATICMTKEHCEDAATKLGLLSIYSAFYHTKGCFQKNGKVFWGGNGTDDEIAELELPGEQQRVFCNNPEAREIVIMNPFPRFVMPLWTVTEYHPSLEVGEDVQLVEPIDGTAMTLKLDPFGDIYGETGCNSYMGRYKNMKSTSFDIDGAIGQTTMGCAENLMKQEENYLYNWWFNTTMIYWDLLQDGSLELRNGDHPNRVMAKYKTVCLTEETCDEAAIKAGFEIGYTSPDFPTKGCFSKNNVAFWSEGTETEKAEVNLPGVQERIFCGIADEDVVPWDANTPSPSPTDQAEFETNELPVSSGKVITLGIMTILMAVVSTITV